MLEVMVVLTIVGLVSAVSMTLLSQLRFSLDRLYPEAEKYTKLQLRTMTLSDTIAGLLPSRAPAPPFVGGPTTILGLGSHFPAQAWAGEHDLRISIAAVDNLTSVKADKFGPTGEVLASFEFMKLRCIKARFRYLDLDMTWQENWSQRTEYPFLPLAIWFHCEQDREAVNIISAVEREGVSIVTDVSPLSAEQ